MRILRESPVRGPPCFAAYERLHSANVSQTHGLEAAFEIKRFNHHVAVEKPDVLKMRGGLGSKHSFPEESFHPRYMCETCTVRKAGLHVLWATTIFGVVRIEDKAHGSPARTHGCHGAQKSLGRRWILASKAGRAQGCRERI